MASQYAVAKRRARVTARLEAAQAAIEQRFGVTVKPQRVTKNDPALAQVQRLENVAALMEAALQIAQESGDPMPEDSTEELVEDTAEELPPTDLPTTETQAAPAPVVETPEPTRRTTRTRA